MAWYTRSWKKSEDGVRAVVRGGGGIGGKYYDSKQQETVMDRRERAHGPRAAFPLYKSPPVLRDTISDHSGEKGQTRRLCAVRPLSLVFFGLFEGYLERERSAIGLETAALIDATAVEATKGRGENDRKADSCGETERTKITMKREVGEKIERTEKKRKGEGRGDERDDAEGREVQLGCSTSNEERESMRG
ncbi:hypothetical protein ALC57_06095 [Trachymyrmex cornetzi]|uniref:Uncharacterized protein n=1 Tax=Trachymyrmex cornetzi TaxID=471704 RepID=A0A195E9J1_9HYME|nr:hypothetical protein ALC57_06095 [Trachymyrmex cornetzi]